VLRNINKVDEFAAHYNNLNLRYAEKLRGFDPNNFLLEHLLTVGLNIFFFQKYLRENKDTCNNTHDSDVGDLDTLPITTKLYKKWGKGPDDQGVQSPHITPKSTTS
jgi:hypothetical protein